MFERLLETWLDSASERSYQAPFCQVLAAEGYTIVHTTRHSPIEFGKDIIARAPDGKLCAFQLKGNPGARLTVAGFREIQLQLVQLATQPVVIPGVAHEPHRSYLVTNGLFEEETSRALGDLNVTAAKFNGSIECWARGELLALFKRHAATFWPTELEELGTVLKLLADEGDGQPPFELLHVFLSGVLRLKPDDERPKAPELVRRATSAALLLPIVMRSFALRENHFALAGAWTLLVAYVVAAYERWQHDVDEVSATLDLAYAAVLDSVAAILCEARDKEYLLEGHPAVDALVLGVRQTLLASLCAAWWAHAHTQQKLPERPTIEELNGLMARVQKAPQLWGEAAMPQLLATYWFCRAHDGSMAVDGLLVSLVQLVTQPRGTGEERRTLPPSYYSAEDVLLHKLSKRDPSISDPMRGDDPRVASAFAEPILHLLVRQNLKQTCKQLWPAVSRTPAAYFLPATPWEFCLFRAKNGKNLVRMIAPSAQWTELQEAARCIGAPEVPRYFRDRPALLLLFTILLPFRATPNVVRYLGYRFNDAWFGPSPSETVPM